MITTIITFNEAVPFIWLMFFLMSFWIYYYRHKEIVLGDLPILIFFLIIAPLALLLLIIGGFMEFVSNNQDKVILKWK